TVLDDLKRAVGVYGDIVPRRDGALLLVPRRRDVGVRPREDGHDLTPYVTPLGVGPGHVSVEVALRSGVGVEKQGQVAGDKTAVAARRQDGEAVLLDELVELGLVGLGEGGGDVHSRTPGSLTISGRTLIVSDDRPRRKTR